MCEGGVSVRAIISARNMALSPRILRLSGASLLAVLMVGGAYVVSGPVPFFKTNIADAQSSAELLRTYAAKDSDTDGLPDWQEALYGTDPLDPESFRAGTKDGDAVAQGLIEPKVTVAEAPKPTDPSTVPGTPAAPNSTTDRFAQAFLKQYLLTRGETPPTQEEITSFVESSIADLSSSSASPDTYTAADVRVSGASGTAALVSYAASVENVFATYTVSTEKNELSYFADALNEDASALKKIEDISSAYKSIAKALIALPVPAEAAPAHRSIANALVHMSEVSADMATMKTDPLRALMGIGLYGDYAARVVTGFAGLNGIFTARQVVLPAGTPGAEVVQVAKNASIKNQ